jgi:hypothetical protein
MIGRIAVLVGLVSAGVLSLFGCSSDSKSTVTCVGVNGDHVQDNCLQGADERLCEQYISVHADSQTWSKSARSCAELGFVVACPQTCDSVGNDMVCSDLFLEFGGDCNSA